MSTSLDRVAYKATAKKFLYLSIFLIIFDIIYEQFSHGVISYYMRLAFIFPLLGGTVLHLFLERIPKPSKSTLDIWKMSLATLIIGFLLKGVFDIYGSVYSLVYGFFYAGLLLLLLSIILYLFDIRKHKKLSIQMK